MKLMIVDDNEDVRIFLRSLFEHTADEIIECSDGLSAVKSYEIQHPDYVLMDIEMKGMDGLTATEKIMKSDPGAKIIIVTSHNNQNLRNAAAVLGAKAFVSKDNLFELENIIKK